MYQHDIKENRLTKTLNDIVTECVSFVGESFFQHFPHVSCQAWRNIFKSSGDKSIHIHLTVYPIWLRVAVEYFVAKKLGSTIEKLHIKFVISKKAIKNDEIFTVDLTLTKGQ